MAVRARRADGRADESRADASVQLGQMGSHVTCIRDVLAGTRAALEREAARAQAQSEVHAVEVLILLPVLLGERRQVVDLSGLGRHDVVERSDGVSTSVREARI